MATIIKRSGKYQAQIRRSGCSVSKTFIKRSDAMQWARKIESEMERGLYIESSGLADQTSLSTLLDYYSDKILPTKKGREIEKVRIALFRRCLGERRLSQFRPHIINTYRDNRLKTVQPSTVKRELGLLSRIFNSAEREFGIPLPHGNPVNQVSPPKEPPGRNRRPSDEELRLLFEDKTVGEIVSFAIETGMRRGEIVSIEWKDISWGNSTLVISATKTGVARTIPLTSKAREQLSERLRQHNIPTSIVWLMRPHSITQAFKRACKRYGIKDLRFHDLRHEATSRFFEMGLNPVEVASITGHKDTRMLMRYTHLKPELLALKLK